MLFQPNLILLIFVTPRLLIPGFELLGLCFPILTLISQCSILRSPYPTKHFTWITESMKNSCWLRWYGRVQWGWEWQHRGGLRSCTTTENVCVLGLDTKHGICPCFSSQIHTGKSPSPKAAQLEPALCRCCLSITCVAPASPILSYSGKPRKGGKNCSSNAFQKCQHSSICISRQTDFSVTNYSSVQHLLSYSAKPI